MPPLIIEMNNVPLSQGDARALGEVRVHQALSLPTACELAFYQPEGSMIGGGEVQPGTVLRIRIQDQSPLLFDGEVTAVIHEYGPMGERLVRIRGYDLLHRLRKRQPVRSHIQLNLFELARILVADLGISVSAQDPGLVREEVFQHGQSDLDLLIEASSRFGRYFTLRPPVLSLLSLEGIGTTVPLHLGQSLIEAQIEVNAEAACSSIEVQGWDPRRTATVIGFADRARSSRNISTGVFPEQVGGRPERTIVDVLAQNDAQAARMAQAELDHRTARAVVFHGIAEGNPSLRPGTPVEIGGLARALSGNYVLTAVRHVIDRERGYISELDTSPPPQRPRMQGTVTTLGVVSRVDDPDGMGRVRVILPNYGDLEAGWFNVLIPGAGANKGIVALPDVDDQVLVVLFHADPSQGVVLGGLYGVAAPPDAGVEDGAVRRYSMTTPGGLRVKLDDTAKTVDVQNSEGDRMTLSPERVLLVDNRGSSVELGANRCQIFSKTDLIISAPERKISISGQHIDFEKK
jgi:phage baseplate assembly protein gpV